MASKSDSVSMIYRSTTRRKACNACVKAKRRCDLEFPSCKRCQNRCLPCVYLDENGKFYAPRSANSDNRRTTIHSERSGILQDTDLVLMETKLLPVVNTSSHSDEITIFSSSPCLDPSHELLFDLKCVQPVYITQQQLEFIISHFRDVVRLLVLEGGTPFIHRSYQETMPSAYQDALSICSLYVHKTSSNQDTIFRILDCKIGNLLQDSKSTKIEDNLLDLQVLILYQIIRLLDGDTQQYANAERQLELLDLWTLRLQRNYWQAFDEIRSGYERWVLFESIRRTTMMSVMVRSLHHMMRTGYCELAPLFTTLPVSTGSSQLWKTDYEWEEAAQKSEVLTYAEFTDAWNRGDVDGSRLEDYEKLLLMACRYAKVAGKLGT